MNDFPFKIVGFDLDGTLVDSALDLAPAINHALAATGRPSVSADQTRSLIGGGAKLMLERALKLTGGMIAGERFETLYAVLLAYYRAHIADHTVAYDGCLAALDELAARGVKLAVVTNKAEDLARELLDRLQMTPRFTSIVGGDTLGRERAKPAPDLIHETIARCGGLANGERFAMVGDSTFDVKAARGAGWPVAALSFGYHDVPPVELGADVLVDHWRDLIAALEKL